VHWICCDSVTAVQEKNRLAIAMAFEIPGSPFVNHGYALGYNVLQAINARETFTAITPTGVKLEYA